MTNAVVYATYPKCYEAKQSSPKGVTYTPQLPRSLCALYHRWLAFTYHWPRKWPSSQIKPYFLTVCKIACCCIVMQIHLGAPSGQCSQFPYCTSFNHEDTLLGNIQCSPNPDTATQIRESGDVKSQQTLTLGYLGMQIRITPGQWRYSTRRSGCNVGLM